MIYNLFVFQHAFLRIIVCIIPLVNLYNSVYSQNGDISLVRKGLVVRDQMNRDLNLASVGGIYSPIFLESDLNLDGENDLIIWDRGADIVRNVVWDGNQNKYVHAPEIEAYFPTLTGWVQTKDYNNDGIDDLFVYSEGFPEQGILVYKGILEDVHISYQLLHADPEFSSPVLTFLNSEGQRRHIFVSEIDIPSFVDVDDDGDVDVLSFDQDGSYVRWYENRSEAGTLEQFVLADDCWGKFVESNISSEIKLSDNGECPGIFSRQAQVPLHSGSALFAADLDYDDDVDLLVGDLSQNNVTLLVNGSDVNLDYMVFADDNFPNYDTAVDVAQFPAISCVDVNRDGLKDLIFSPNRFPEQDRHSTWLYILEDSLEAEYHLRQKNWLSDQMNDLGSLSSVTALIEDQRTTLLLFAHDDQLITFRFAELSNDSLTLITDLSSEGFGNRQSVIPSQTVSFADYHQLVLGFDNGELAIARVSENQFSDIQNINGIDVGSDAAPTLLDYDKDGDLDLIVGELSGTLNLYNNIGDQMNWIFDSVAVSQFFGQINVRIPGSFEGQSTPFAFTQDSISYLICGSNSSQISVYKIDYDDPNSAFEVIDDQLLDENAQGRRTAPNGFRYNGQPLLIIGDIRGGYTVYDLMVNSTVSTDETLAEGIEIELYPNPLVKGSLLTFNSPVHIDKIELIDLTGKIVQVHSDFPFGQSTFDVNIDISSGIYFARIILSSGETVTKKLSIID